MIRFLDLCLPHVGAFLAYRPRRRDGGGGGGAATRFILSYLGAYALGALTTFGMGLTIAALLIAGHVTTCPQMPSVTWVALSYVGAMILGGLVAVLISKRGLDGP